METITKEVIYTSTTKEDDKLIINAVSSRKDVTCPFCGTIQKSQHSKFKRLLQDLPIDGKPTFISLENRIMKCKNPECEHNTFSEEFSFAPLKAKYTNRLVIHILEVANTTSNRKACEILNNEGIIIGKSVISKIMIKNGQ